MQTAVSCIKEIFPNSKVTPNGTNNYPIRVKITAEYGGQKVDIWSGSQKDLFRKYGAKRQRSMEQIKEYLTEYAEDAMGN